MKRICACLALALTTLLPGCWGYVSTEARERFQARRGPCTVTVYPVNVSRRGGGTTADGRLGRDLAAWMNAQGIAQAVPGRPGVPIRPVWRANEARMAQGSAEAFGAWVREAAIGTEYALLVEILCGADESQVLAVHVYLAEASGRVAAGGLANGHGEAFKRLRPSDRQGALAVAQERILELWAGPPVR
ncbi:MAG TPA: hypothetical protein VK188_02900 [Holophaga sp.]|nr:hypothetical protein [Holophaga sp.]